ncbi:hypothetical protein JKP88DRAFT_247631 [Tribonema minus]|uniref:Uncharacterized protein n=1 Tax=Tribonema minus TaxID=303371 RepID=A0A836CBQ2_9STRA|nr:hypothetical protein JKP88DRAFT_247631 [Tribonema minus]
MISEALASLIKKGRLTTMTLELAKELERTRASAVINAGRANCGIFRIGHGIIVKCERSTSSLHTCLLPEIAAQLASLTRGDSHFIHTYTTLTYKDQYYTFMDEVCTDVGSCARELAVHIWQKHSVNTAPESLFMDTYKTNPDHQKYIETDKTYATFVSEWKDVMAKYVTIVILQRFYIDITLLNTFGVCQGDRKSDNTFMDIGNVRRSVSDVPNVLSVDGVERELTCVLGDPSFTGAFKGLKCANPAGAYDYHKNPHWRALYGLFANFWRSDAAGTVPQRHSNPSAACKVLVLVQ